MSNCQELLSTDRSAEDELDAPELLKRLSCLKKPSLFSSYTVKTIQFGYHPPYSRLLSFTDTDLQKQILHQGDVPFFNLILPITMISIKLLQQNHTRSNDEVWHFNSKSFLSATFKTILAFEFREYCPPGAGVCSNCPCSIIEVPILQS